MVSTIFDKRWAGMAPLLTILAAMEIVRPLNWTLNAFLQAQQRTRALMMVGFIKVGSLLGLISTIGRISPAWTCLCVGIAYATYAGSCLLVIHLYDGVSMRRYLWAVARPVLACAPMFGAVAGLRIGLQYRGLGPTWGTLVAEIAVGGLTYVVSAFVIAKPVVDDVLNLVRNALRSRSAA
jgi:PST family polysaccharide transporter